MAGDILWAGSSFPWMYISADTPSLIVLSLLSTLISTLKVLVFLSADEAIKVTSPEMYLPEINFALALEPKLHLSYIFFCNISNQKHGIGIYQSCTNSSCIEEITLFNPQGF